VHLGTLRVHARGVVEGLERQDMKMGLETKRRPGEETKRGGDLRQT
jgi:hypothetical protein